MFLIYSKKAEKCQIFFHYLSLLKKKNMIVWRTLSYICHYFTDLFLHLQEGQSDKGSSTVHSIPHDLYS